MRSRAWCRHTTFDNLRKMIALRAAPPDAPLPGGTAGDFFEAWLTGGTGGTCWPGSNALFELVHGIGFDAVRATASMRDVGRATHGSVRVTLDGAHWLIDSSVLTEVPVPLTHTVVIENDPVFGFEIEPDNGTHVLWVSLPTADDLCCRILEYGVSHGEYLERYEASRVSSPFNDAIYARRNLPGELVILRGPTHYSKTAEGVEKLELSPAGLCECLRDEFGFSGAIVDQWIAAGGLSASFEPFKGPPPPVDPRRPPSQRQTAHPHK